MPQPEGRLQIGEVGESLQRPIELIIRKAPAETGIERDHLVPGLNPTESREHDLGTGEEAVDESGVELRAAAFARNRNRALDASGVVEGFEVVGELDEPHHQGEVVAAAEPGNASPVPALEGL